MLEKIYYVYIMASYRNGSLYIGVTSDLLNRIAKHKQGYYINSFTSKYKINKLIYYESYGDVIMAINREHQLKKWNRLWKLKLIETVNPEWRDLYYNLLKL